MFKFICLRGPVITDGLRSYSIAFRDYCHIAVKRDDYELLERFLIRIVLRLIILVFVFLWLLGVVFLRFYLDLYAAGATFYANFYCSRPEVAFAALFHLLMGM